MNHPFLTLNLFIFALSGSATVIHRTSNDSEAYHSPRFLNQTNQTMNSFGNDTNKWAERRAVTFRSQSMHDIAPSSPRNSERDSLNAAIARRPPVATNHSMTRKRGSSLFMDISWISSHSYPIHPINPRRSTHADALRRWLEPRPVVAASTFLKNRTCCGRMMRRCTWLTDKCDTCTTSTGEKCSSSAILCWLLIFVILIGAIILHFAVEGV